MYSYGPPHMAVQKQDDQHEHTFSNYVKIQDVVPKTCLRWWTIGKSGERGSGISVLPARHDDDDDNRSNIPHTKNLDAVIRFEVFLSYKIIYTVSSHSFYSVILSYLYIVIWFQVNNNNNNNTPRYILVTLSEVDKRWTETNGPKKKKTNELT